VIFYYGKHIDPKKVITAKKLFALNKKPSLPTIINMTFNKKKCCYQSIIKEPLISKVASSTIQVLRHKQKQTHLIHASRVQNHFVRGIVLKFATKNYKIVEDLD